MTPREAAEKRELELALDHFAKRALQNAGDAAELKEAFEQAAKEIADLKARPVMYAGTEGFVAAEPGTVWTSAPTAGPIDLDADSS
jgi:hypothetical protein